jgi:peptidoglycan hydrolase CwlO-like protein
MVTPAMHLRARRLLGVLMVAFVFLAPASPAYAETVAQLKAQLAQIRDQLQPVTDAYDSAETALQNTQYRIKRTSVKIRSVTAKLFGAQDVLGARADALYRTGGEMGILGFVLGATTWDDLVTRMDYVTMIADSDAALVKGVKDTRMALQAQRTELTATAAAEKKAVAVTAARQRAM